VPFRSYLAKLLVELKRNRVSDSPWIFSLYGIKPLAASTWQKAMLDAAIGNKISVPWALHDLRRSARTILREVVRVPIDTCEKILGHGLPRLIGIYDRGKFSR
jgi:integrase